MSKSAWVRTAAPLPQTQDKAISREQEDYASMMQILTAMEAAMDHGLYTDAATFYNQYIKPRDTNDYPDTIFAYEMLSLRRVIEAAQETAARLCLQHEKPENFLYDILEDVQVTDYDFDALCSRLNKYTREYKQDAVLPTIQNNAEYAIVVYDEIINTAYHAKKDYIGDVEKALYKFTLKRMDLYLQAMYNDHDLQTILTPTRPEKGISTIDHGFSAVNGALRIQFAQTSRLLSTATTESPEAAPVLNALLIRQLFLYDTIAALHTMYGRGLWPTLYEEYSYHLLVEYARTEKLAPDMTPMMGPALFTLRCYHDAMADFDNEQHALYPTILAATAQETINLSHCLLSRLRPQ